MTFTIAYADLSDVAKGGIDFVEAKSTFDALAAHPITQQYTERYDRNDPHTIRHICDAAYDDEIIVIVRPVTLSCNNQA